MKNCRNNFQVAVIATAARAYIDDHSGACATTKSGHEFIREKKRPESIGQVGVTARNPENRTTGAEAND